jgi:hypothetical protein
VAETGALPRISDPLNAAVLAFLEETDPQAWVCSSLAYAAARLALGHDFADVAKPSLLGFELKRSRALAAASNGSTRRGLARPTRSIESSRKDSMMSHSAARRRAS